LVGKKRSPAIQGKVFYLGSLGVAVIFCEPSKLFPMKYWPSFRWWRHWVTREDFHQAVHTIGAILSNIEKNIMTKLSDLEGVLDGISDQVTKSQDEITAEIKTLTDALAAGGNTPLSPAAEASLTRLKGLVQGLDDINPDVPPPPPPVEPPVEPPVTA
jgi:hypothetical protein